MGGKNKKETLESLTKDVNIPYNKRRKAKYKLMNVDGVLGNNELKKYFQWRNSLPKYIRFDLPSEFSKIKRVHYDLAGQRYAEYFN